MRIELRLCTLAMVLTLAGLASPRFVEAAALQGVVKDLGATDQSKEGIAGVRITVKDRTDRELATGLTDTEGHYKIDLPNASAQLTAIYDKIGYQSRPTVKSVKHIDKEQAPVFMVQEAASEQYYQTVAKNASLRSAESSEVKQEVVSLVLELSATDRSLVVASLKNFAGGDALNEAMHQTMRQAQAARKKG